MKPMELTFTVTNLSREEDWDEDAKKDVLKDRLHVSAHSGEEDAVLRFFVPLSDAKEYYVGKTLRVVVD